MAGILIIRLKGLGDIVHLIPSLRMLRQKSADMPLALLCQKPFGEIIPEELGLEVFQLAPHAGISDTFRLLKQIRKHKFDYVFDLFANPRTAVISFLSGIKNRYGFDYRFRRHAYTKTYNPNDPNIHLMKLFRDFFAEFGFDGTVTHPNLKPEKSAFDSLAEKLVITNDERPLLGINPHTTYPSKAWPEDYYIEFVKLWHRKTGKKTLVTWGPGEKKAAERIVKVLGNDIAFVQPEVNIMEFAALLSRLDLFLTADTGPMNIAWAVNTPTAAIFGPTTRKAVAPEGKQHLVIFNKELDCLECHQENCSHKSCMTTLTPEIVFRQVYEHLNRNIGQKNE